MSETAVTVTTIHPPNSMMQAFADGCRAHGFQFVVTGDEQTPDGYRVSGSDYYDLAAQRRLPFAFARVCPTRSVARKNLAYLIALSKGAKRIIETDDDNSPYEEFWQDRSPDQDVPVIEGGGFVNAYRYFSETMVWPRGFPLEAIRSPRASPPWESLQRRKAHCPVHAGLADLDPDVDAIYRLTRDLPLSLRRDRRVALLEGSFCPFNSQNTTWHPESHPLMYLPSTCTFRVADIWRSFVVQRILWTNGWGVLHHEPTLFQDRSPHDLLRDFESEIPGYLHNAAICEALGALSLRRGQAHLLDNLRVAYEALVVRGHLVPLELERLEAWIEDVASLA